MCEVMQKYEEIARQEGIKEGIKEGKKEGILMTLWALVNDGTISISLAAQKAGLSEKKFIETKPAI